MHLACNITQARLRSTYKVGFFYITLTQLEFYLKNSERFPVQAQHSIFVLPFVFVSLFHFWFPLKKVMQKIRKTALISSIRRAGLRSFSRDFASFRLWPSSSPSVVSIPLSHYLFPFVWCINFWDATPRDTITLDFMLKSANLSCVIALIFRGGSIAVRLSILHWKFFSLFGWGWEWVRERGGCL